MVFRPSRKVFEVGDLLIEEGKPATSMFVVEEGEVTILRYEGTRRITVATLGPHSLVGEMALIEGRPHRLSARATKRTRCAVITKDDFESYLGEAPRFVQLLLMHLVRKLKKTSDRRSRTSREAATESATSNDEDVWTV